MIFSTLNLLCLIKNGCLFIKKEIFISACLTFLTNLCYLYMGSRISEGFYSCKGSNSVKYKETN